MAMKSLEKAIDIIELISDSTGLGVREISARTGYPPATVHRIVAALADRKYLQQDPRTKNYTLAPHFMALGERAQKQFDLVPVARVHLENLLRQTGENANLTVRDGWEVVYIDHLHSNEHSLQLFTRLGARVPLYCCGVGKMFMSYFTEEELDRYLASSEFHPYTPYTFTEPKRMREEIALIRKQGYAIDDQEKEMGVRCVAAPIMGRGNEMVASLSVSGATQRVSDDRLPALAALVMECGVRISRELGCNGAS
jgi:DNA-binding IclR family transcriptional regulator